MIIPNLWKNKKCLKSPTRYKHGLILPPGIRTSKNCVYDPTLDYSLVGGFNPSEKYESQSGRMVPYMMENKT